MIYLIGSLRNPKITEVAARLRAEGYEVFDDWYSPGPHADDHWQAYERQRGHTYKQALQGYAARQVFEFDHYHLNRADVGVMVMPAGKSGHLELGYMAGKGKLTFVLFDEEPERYDVMYQFCTDVCFYMEELLKALEETK